MAGFTMAEVLIVVAILGIRASVAFAAVSVHTEPATKCHNHFGRMNAIKMVAGVKAAMAKCSKR